MAAAPHDPRKGFPSCALALEVSPMETERSVQPPSIVNWLDHRAVAPVGAVLAVCVFAVMTWWTWGRWFDVLIDFGREVYVPWRLSDGAVLYRDLAYFDGPLSPYWNALLFRLFGVSIRTIVVTNLVLIAAQAAVIWKLMYEFSSRTGATIATLLFLLVFAFGHYFSTGNYSYVAPYSHPMTHGLLLSSTAVLCLVLLIKRGIGTVGRIALAACGGLLTGLVFLTKAEMFLALAASVGGGLVLLIANNRGIALKATIAEACVWLLCALIAPLASVVLLSGSLGWETALEGTLGTWPHVIEGKSTQLRFYQSIMGIRDPIESIALLLGSAGAWAAVIGGLYVTDSSLRNAKGDRIWWEIGAFALLLFLLRLIPWMHAFRPLPFLMFVLMICQMRLWWRESDTPIRKLAAGQCVVLIWAGMLLAKIFLQSWIVHYGFVLAMPATLITAVVLVDWLPRTAMKREGYGGVLMAGSLGIFAAMCVTLLSTSNHWMSKKALPIGEGADLFLSDDGRGAVLKDVIPALSEMIAEDETLAVIPEGVMINYLVRRENPSRYFTVIPWEVILFEEQNILEDWKANPPDWVLLVHRETAEYGFRWFGHDYGVGLMEWVDNNYIDMRLFGAPPYRDEKFGAMLMRRANY